MSMTDREVDQLLVNRVQKGEKVAFDLLVKKYQSKVQSIVQRLVKDPEESKDVAQEAFIKAYRALGKFRGDSAFYTWIYRIAINTAKNHLVSKGRRPQAAGLDVNEVESYGLSEQFRDLGSPEASLIKDQVSVTIQKTLQSMQDELRTAVTLREFDGLSYEAIAEIMDCPVGTVRSRIFRAREALEKAMKGARE